VLIMHCQYGYGGRCHINVALATMLHEYHALLYFPAIRATESMMLVAVSCPSVVLGHIRQDHFIAACNTAYFALSNPRPGWAARGIELVTLSSRFFFPVIPRAHPNSTRLSVGRRPVRASSLGGLAASVCLDDTVWKLSPALRRAGLCLF